MKFSVQLSIFLEDIKFETGNGSDDSEIYRPAISMASFSVMDKSLNSP